MSAGRFPKGTSRRSFIKLLVAAGIGLVEGTGLAEYVIPPLSTHRTLTTTVTSTLTATGSFSGSQTALDGAAVSKYIPLVLV